VSSSSYYVGNVGSLATGAIQIQIDIVSIAHQRWPVRNQISLTAGQQDSYVGLVEFARRSRRRGWNFAEGWFANNLDLLRRPIRALDEGKVEGRYSERCAVADHSVEFARRNTQPVVG